MTNGNSPFIAPYALKKGQVLYMPSWVPGVPKSGSPVKLVPVGPPPQGKKRKLSTVAIPATPKTKKQKASKGAAAPQTSGVGVMDIGQGNWNMLVGPVDGNGRADVLAYYDSGYPLWFYTSSVPVPIRTGARRAIRQNATLNLEGILSHWDWDHWRGAALQGLNGLFWTMPVQPRGASATNFLNSIAAARLTMVAAGTAPMPGPGGSTIRCCQAAGLPVAALINNSGLALNVPILLPANAAAPRQVLLTGDANFPSAQFPAGIFNSATGILAVHHGSAAHGADQNLPAPANPAQAAGFIAYSYGITVRNGIPNAHAYGFPAQAAINSYRNDRWTTQRSTAQGQTLVGLNTNGRGNIRFGAQLPLLAAYQNSCFYPIVSALS